MKFRTLGNSGLRVSLAGLGCNNFGMKLDQAGTDTVVNAALDHGITLFDTANVYGNGESEVFLGKALGARRDEVIIATKFGMPMGDGPYNRGGSRHYIFQQVEHSLRRLGTDYIDVYQMHAPDPGTPIEETLEALDDLVRDGKVRYIGSSNFSGWQIADAEWTASNRNLNRFISAQNEWSLINRAVEQEVIPACDHYQVGQLPYFPLASGFLTGKYRRGEDMPEGSRLALWQTRAADRVAQVTSDQNWDLLDALTSFAKSNGHTILELALSWLASYPATSSVFAGATTAEQIESNVAATLAWELTDDQTEKLNGILAGGE